VFTARYGLSLYIIEVNLSLFRVLNTMSKLRKQHLESTNSAM
jgi:hypothetical protein